MPYSSLLAGLAEWFCQLWAESLGKSVDAGSTPVRALGTTDQHSQLQLYMQGPQDKLITFVDVEKYKHQVVIPNLYPDQEELSYLGDHSLGELLATEKRATAFNLMKAGRPSLSLKLPEINAFTVGQLIYLLEVATVAAAHFFGINPLDQPGVEGGKKTTYGLMGRQGYEDQQKEFAQAKPALEKYTDCPEPYETSQLTTPWWRPGRDLNPFGLVKFFSLPGFIVILIFTGILVVFLTVRAQQMTLKKNEDYLILLASNLNHQIYQQFVLPTAFEKGGRITLSDPEQSKRLDEVVRNTIHGFHVEQLNQYDQEGVFSYSTAADLPLGKKCDNCHRGPEGPGRGKLLRDARLQRFFEHPLAQQREGANPQCLHSLSPGGQAAAPDGAGRGGL